MSSSRLIPGLIGGALLAGLVVGVLLFLSSRNDDDAEAATSPTTTEGLSELEMTSSTEPLPVSTTIVDSTESIEVTTTTTTVAPAVICSAARYSITVPEDWFEDSCTQFSEGPIATAGGREFRPEIDLAFATSETFAEALARIDATQVVLSSSSTTIDGLPARRMVLFEEWFEVGERTVVVVDAVDGVFFASANELVDIDAPTTMSLEARYAQTLGVFDTMLSTLDIVEGTAVTCPAPTFDNPIVTTTGTGDVNGDGDLETMRLVVHDNGVAAVLDGYNGTVWGQVSPVAIPGIAHIGWHDWDADDVPELIFRDHSPASGDSYGVLTVQGCSLVPVVDGAGYPISLMSRASGLTADGYICLWEDDGSLESIQFIHTEMDPNGGAATHTVSTVSYANGTTTLEFASITTANLALGPGAGPAGCVVSLF